jgi:hypothetical protein
MAEVAMSKKTLNEANLAALGADRLAHLLMEVSTGSAEIKRRIRLELSHNLGSEELARDVQKRLTSIRRSKSRVSWRKRKSLIKDLSTQAEMIADKIAPEAPSDAFDLLWQFIEMAPSVYLRVDDSRGEVADVFHAAFVHFDEIAPRAQLGPMDLAARVWDAVRENSCGEFDGIVPILAPTLGREGLDHLKALVLAHKDTAVEESDDHAALQFLRDLRSSGGSFVEDQKARLIRTTLQDIATAQGDTDAYIAQYSSTDLMHPRIAAEVAMLYLDSAKPQDALDILCGADLDGAQSETEWDHAYVACLLALGRVDDAQAHRWACFTSTLDAQHLRDHLKVLPDFDDIEVEDAAKAHALEHEDTETALQFFLEWPDLPHAAQLITQRISEIDGHQDHILAPAAETLRNRYPLAAVLLWRVMIDYTLWDGRAKQYPQSVDFLMDCTAADNEIEDYGRFHSHQTYLDSLRERYAHKASFWAKVR